MEIEFKGSKYKIEGENLYRDGVLQETKVPQKVETIDKIEALKVGEYSYFNGEFYQPPHIK